MGKIVAIAGTGAGVSALSFGGYYLLKNGSGEGENGNNVNTSAGATSSTITTPSLLENAEAYSSSDAFKPVDLNKFKEEPFNSKECIKDIFPSADTVTLNVSENNPSDFPTGFFGDAPSEDTSSTIKGCLIINYERKTKSDAENK